MVALDQRVLAAFARLHPAAAARGGLLAKPAASDAAAATTAAQWKVKVGDDTFGVRLHDQDPGGGGALGRHRDLKTATDLLSDAGLTPRTIAWDDEAFVRDWTGVPVLHCLPDDRKKAIATVSSLGDTFARLHNIPVPRNWEPYPSISSDASHLEVMIDWAHGKEEHSKVKQTCLDVVGALQRLDPPEPILGDEIVLTHGDAKPGNVLRTDDNEGFIFIDLPTVGRRAAIEELSYVYFLWNSASFKTVDTLPDIEKYSYFGDREVRRAFVTSYLIGRGRQDVSIDQIDGALWEIECHVPRTMIYLSTIMKHLSTSSTMEPKLLLYASECSKTFPFVAKKLASRLACAAKDGGERQRIIDNGVCTGCL